MKNTTINIAACIATFATTAGASTINQISRSADGIPYDYLITLGGSDLAEFSAHVGAWSWEDNSLFGGSGQGTEPVGWTHTSVWASVVLTEDTYFTLRMDCDPNVPWPSSQDLERKASIDFMFPSFSLYGGVDTDGEQVHTYSNRTDIDWAEDVGMIGFVDNSTQIFAERQWFLPPGSYTLALGSNAPSTNSNRQGFHATLTTIPEPGSATLILAGLLAVYCRRQRAAVR